MGLTPRPFTYDFRRTLTSGTVIAVIVITVVLSLAFIPIFKAASPTSPIPPSGLAGVAYYDNSTGVNVLVYSFNQFGGAISGTQVNVTAQSGSATKNAIASTNGSGLALVTINLPYPPVGASNGLIVSSGNNGMQESFPLASGVPSTLFGNPIAPVIDASNSSKVDVSVFYTAPLGAPPKGYRVYYSLNMPIVYANTSESSMTFLGQMNTYFQVFSFPPGTSINSSDSIFIGLFDPSGTEVTGYGTSGFIFQTSTAVQQLSGIQSLASEFVGGLLGLFIPLMAILASYSTYGKDRVSGVLESVLARPVSRRGLSISRYASTALAMVVAVILTILALDAVVYYEVGFGLTSNFLATAIAALSVEAGAFAGVMFALSRGIRSGGALVGIGVGLWAVLELFWGLILYLVVTLGHIDFGSAAYYRLFVDSNFFNPAQFYSLVSTLASSSFNGFQFNPADYWITPFTLVAAGVLWVALPFSLFLYLAIKKD